MTPAASNLTLLVDESISSWKLRHLSMRGTVAMPSASRDRDFGQLQLRHPDIPDSLFVQLQKAAQAPDPWLLSSGLSRQICPRCLAEDWASGQPSYERRAWRIAWHTCCQRHGLYVLESEAAKLHGFKTAIRWPLVGLSYPAWCIPSEIHLATWRAKGWGRQQVTTFRASFTGRRAVHLENALSQLTFFPSRRWRPLGLSMPTLRTVYSAIVKALMKQFSVDHWEKIEGPPQFNPIRFNSRVWKDLGMFSRLIPEVRFSINVLVEAILSDWTKSPLPGEAGSHASTQQLVRAIGWEFGAPGTIEPDCCTRTAEPHWEALLRATQQKETSRTGSKPSSNNETFPPASKSSSNHAAERSLPKRDNQARMLEMLRFYKGHQRVMGMVRYHESMKIKEKRDLQSKDRI